MKDYSLMSLVEIAIDVQSQPGSKEITFLDLYNKVCEIKGFDEEERKKHIAQFYTDVTACGDFVYCGEDLWDLKRNQKLEAMDSEFYNEHIAEEEEEEEEEKPKRKKATPNKTYSAINGDDDEDEDDSNLDEDYENADYDSDYESSEEDGYDDYEKDFDYDPEDDDSQSEEEEDNDEDEYNAIMDDYENLYDD